MAGWRDSEGRTATERTRERTAGDRARFMDTLRNRPASLLKTIVAFVFVLLLALALIVALR